MFYAINLIVFTLYSILLGLQGHAKEGTDSTSYEVGAFVMLAITSPLSFWKLCRLFRQFLHLWRDDVHGAAGGLKYWLFSGR